VCLSQEMGSWVAITWSNVTFTTLQGKHHLPFAATPNSNLLLILII
jgi:hypothetical protein